MNIKKNIDILKYFQKKKIDTNLNFTIKNYQ